jgi:hypothetical protein
VLGGDSVVALVRATGCARCAVESGVRFTRRGDRGGVSVGARTTPGNGYFAALNDDTGAHSMFVARAEGGQFTSVIASASVSADFAAPHTLRIVVDGFTVTGSIDGIAIGGVDGVFADGVPAFGLSGADGVFTYVVVYALGP